MNIFELKIWDDESKNVTFYTVQVDGDADNETDKFFSKYENHPKLSGVLQELLMYVLKTIGEDHGALDCFFNRPENEVKGLPHKGSLELAEIDYHFPQFPLRLYALKITEEIVVLFNGGIKDAPTNQESSLLMQWRNACAFARKITEALHDKTIEIDHSARKLYLYNGSEEIIL